MNSSTNRSNVFKTKDVKKHGLDLKILDLTCPFLSSFGENVILDSPHTLGTEFYVGLEQFGHWA